MKKYQKLFKNLTIRYIIQITRRKRAKRFNKRRNLYEARKEEFDRREPYKSVYKTEEGVVKIFVTDHQSQQYLMKH